MIGRLLGWIVLIAGIFVGSQFVQFTTQYRIGLANRVDVLEKQVGDMREQAQRNGLDLDGWIRHFEQGDDIVREDAKSKRATITKATRLREDLDAIQAANAVTLPFVFASHLDGEVLQTTREQYTPGIPADLTGWIYTGAGAVLGMIVGAFFAPRPRRRFRRA